MWVVGLQAASTKCHALEIMAEEVLIEMRCVMPAKGHEAAETFDHADLGTKEEPSESRCIMLAEELQSACGGGEAYVIDGTT